MCERVHVCSHVGLWEFWARRRLLGNLGPDGHHCGNGEGATAWGWLQGHPLFSSQHFISSPKKSVFRPIVSPTRTCGAWLTEGVCEASTFFLLFAHPCQCCPAKKGLSLRKNTNGNQQDKGVDGLGLTARDQVDLTGVVGWTLGCPCPDCISHSCRSSRQTIVGTGAELCSSDATSFALLGSWCLALGVGLPVNLGPLYLCLTLLSQQNSVHQRHLFKIIQEVLWG